MNTVKHTWLLLTLAALSSSFAIRPDHPAGDANAQGALSGAEGNTRRDRKLAKLERLGLRHLLEAGESAAGSRIGLGLKGPAENRIVERFNRRLAPSGGEVRITGIQEDGIGNRHIRILQYYKGIPIVGADMVIHVDAKNAIYGVGGDMAQALTPALSARLDAAMAEESARTALSLDLAAQSLEAPRQVIYDGKLAYEVALPGEKPDVWQCYVDANTGEVLYRANRVLHAAPVGGAQAVVHGLILPDEGGTDENVSGWLDTQNRFFLQHTLEKWGVYDEDAADWEQQSTADWGVADRAAMSLGRNLAVTQDYVKTVLGRNGFDGQGTFARGIVHVGTNYVNAYWDGNYLHFGDGNGTTSNALTVADVVAHEYGHAITQHTSGLIYSGESGALNESFSDIIGTLVEFHAQPDGRTSYPSGQNGRADYLMGEDCWVSQEALRDLRNPMRYGQPSYYGGTYWAAGNDVHVNSGVQNFALFLLAEGGNGSNDGHPYSIQGLGIQDAGRIAMYANMFLLTSGSNYRDARDAWVQAAATLGLSATTVSDVWAACGIAPMESHLAATPAALDFGNVGVGGTEILTLTLRNNAGAATLVTGLAFSNPRFTTTAAAPISVPAGGSVPLQIRFSPTSLSAESGTLTVASNALDNPLIVISLAGVGAAGPQATLTPPSMAFSFSPSDAPADRTATLSNLGVANLSYSVSVTAGNIPTLGAPYPAIAGSALSAIPQPPRNDLIYASGNYGQPFAAGQVIVAFKTGRGDFADSGNRTLASGIRELAVAKRPGTGIRSRSGRRLILMDLDGDATVQIAIARLRADANVEYAEPNYVRALVAMPNDPSFASLYGMHNSGQSGGRADADIDAPEAWDRFTGNKNIVLGVIDTGIDYLHPDLAANMWSNEAERNGVAGTDDDGNGFIDDIHGFDFINNDANPMDDHYHGTHCAGTIAGTGNNGVGVAGVAWTASLAALKIFNSGGSTTDAAILNAVDYSNAMGMRITSNSWGGGPYSQSLFDLIDEGRALGHLFIAAAGNSGRNTDTSLNYPSGYLLENIISVAATDRNDNLASFSNYGATSVDLGAPGVDTYSCQPGNRYQNLSGTSMATPHVSGAAYLIWSYKPALTGSEVKAILLSTVDPIAALAGRTLTGGRLNVAKALEESGPAWLSASPAAGSVPGGQTQPINVTVNPARLAAGRWTGEVRVATNDPAHPTLTVNVTADIAGCTNVTLTPSALDFGNVYVGTTGTRALRLENRCNQATVVTGLAASASAFTAAVTLPLTLAPFSLRDISIRFTPAAPGASAATLTVTSDDGVQPVRTVPLTASGVLGPMFRASAASLSAYSSPGRSVTRSLTLYNEGGMPLDWTLSGARVALSDSAESAETAYGPEHFAALAKGEEDTRVGRPVFSSTGGPDTFGYRWVDSDQSGGPAYVWNDISATGTRLAAISGCDDCYQAQALSFPFPFYGQTFSSCYITSNGILTFGSGSSSYSNYPLPGTSAPANMIALFHDDLYPNSSGGIYFKDFGNRAVIQYQNIPAYNGSGSYTFQMELMANGVITYYYKTLGGTITSSTVGIQNATATVGLTTVYNQAYLKNGLAVRIQNAPDWIRVSQTSGTIPAGANRTLGITLDATDLVLGSYATELLIGHTGIGTASPFSLPVTFEVLSAMRGRSRLRSVGPSAQATLRGTSHTLSRLSIGGEAAGTQRGSRYRLRLR